MFLQDLFIDPTFLPGGDNCNFTSQDDFCSKNAYGFIQVLLLLFFYAFVLFWASNLISEGSELLLLIPSLKGIVGSVVLPILGAVPDGAIVLFSGLGPNAQQQVAVGVGALAGSTIMLLTLPWFLSILGGRVDIQNGVPQYKKPHNAGTDWTKLSIKGVAGLTKTGVSIGNDTKTMAKIMFLTSLAYFIIQGPAFRYEKTDNPDPEHEAKVEHNFALSGFVVTMVFFVAYLVYQVKFANTEKVLEQATRKALGQHLVDLAGAFSAELQKMHPTEASALISKPPQRLRDYLHSVFTKFDVDGSKTIDALELAALMRDLNANVSKAQLKELMAEMDTDNSGEIDFDEFVTAVVRYMVNVVHEGDDKVRASGNLQEVAAYADVEPLGRGGTFSDEAPDSDEEEEEDVPEDLQHLDPKAQQRAVLLRSCWMMLLGTVTVLLFSDPMCDVLDNLGTRMKIPSFYVAFVLAPLASNASELIAAYNYAKKKTSKTIAISLATLEGAAIMNNTFCLGIFLILCYLKKLAWEFSAETISILFIEVVMAIYAHKRYHSLLDGILILAMFPASIVLVAILENVAGIN
eukprot:m.27542 g.27542  ORF g.27542 m.27542 type:complete len:576 (+) comp8937_c1_seq2:50-1777(+)